MSNIDYAPFQSLDLGTTKPTSVPQEVIEIQISADNLIGSYGQAFVNETYRVNPLRAEQVNLTAKEVTDYCHYLLVKRVEVINDTCTDYRKLKTLYIPSWIQYCLAMVGQLKLREYGLLITPVIEETDTITFDEAVLISEKIGAFENDLQVVLDAMPRDKAGNKDVMSTAMVADYVRAIKPVEHVAATYVTAFLGMKLKEELAFQVLYRVQYDDIGYVASVLTHAKGLF